MATRTFEAQVLVTGLHDPYTVRVHADAPEQVEGKLRRLLRNCCGVKEVREIQAPQCSSGYSTFGIENGAIVWGGHSDTDAGPGHRGATSRVVVSPDGDIRVELYAAGIDAPFAPIDWKEEALALRAALRTTARMLVERQEAARPTGTAAALDEEAWLDGHGSRN
jgi:hypothetical protein